MKVQVKREGMVRLRRFYSSTKRRSERTVLISAVVRMTGLSRKHLIRLLNGKRRYRKHKGRRPVYAKEARERLVRIWLAMEQLYPKYLHATMSKALQDYAETDGEDPKPIATERLRMSDSTMERILRLHRFNHPRSANKRSGSKAALAAQIPAGPGSLEESGEPGILQVDSIAYCGGDLRFGDYTQLSALTDLCDQWSPSTTTPSSAPANSPKPAAPHQAIQLRRTCEHALKKLFSTQKSPPWCTPQ